MKTAMNTTKLPSLNFTLAVSKRIWLLVFVLITLTAAPAASAAKETIKPDDPFYASSGSWDQKFGDQWGLQRIGFTPIGKGKSAWDEISKATHPVVVAVIDTGLDYFHPDFDRKNLWRNTKEIENGLDDDHNGFVDDLIGWNFVDDNNNPWDRTGHGTHVAGIISASTNNGEGIAGINPNVKIMPLKVLNFVGRGNSSRIAEAIFYAVNNGAQVINLSLGGEMVTRIEKAAVNYANKQGVLLVVASGNTASNTADYGYAHLDSVITVVASDVDDKRATFSNWGQDVKLAAPGIDILSLRARRTDLVQVSGAENYTPGTDFVGKDNKYYRASGTSFAAPFVSGVASLLLSINPQLTAKQVTRMMTMSARDIEVPGWDQLSGYGILDARAAMDADPDYYTDARVESITPVRQDGGIFLQINGTADSSELKDYVLEIGFGESPDEWKRVSEPAKKGVTDGILGLIKAQAFEKRGKWTVRVVINTKKHGAKEGRGSIDVN